MILSSKVLDAYLVLTGKASIQVCAKGCIGMIEFIHYMYSKCQPSLTS